MTPNVIDISHWNTINDFAMLKAYGVLGVIHKCSQGHGYADPLYAKRRKLANAAGLLWGAYAFNTSEPVGDQIENFFSHAEPDSQTLMALDFEDNPASPMSLWQAKQFLTEGGQRLGRPLVFYSGNRVKDLLGNMLDAELGAHRLWHAQYADRCKVQPSWQKPWLWQYSEHGQLHGTDGAVDLNYFDGTAEQLKAQWA